MRLLNSDFDLDQFFLALSKSSQSVLFLDYDGTLAPFTPDRDKAVPYSGVRTRLNRLLGLSRTRLVMVTGRRSEELLPLLALTASPEIWGLHGGERRMPDGRLQVQKLPENVTRGLLVADSWATENNLGDQLESKAISRAFH